MPKQQKPKSATQKVKDFFHFSGDPKQKGKKKSPPQMGGMAGEAQKRVKGRGSQLDRKIKEAGG